MAASQPKLPLWSTAENTQQLPCLNSSNECVDQLTNRAIARSIKFKKLSERITTIDQRLEATGERIDYAKKKQWTNYISTNPVDIIQNIFGGGGVQRDRIAIADLEIKTTDLVAAKAELERQQEEEKLELCDRILSLLLDYEAANRRHELLTSQLETLNQQREVTRIAYKFGQGSTSQILGMEDKRDRLGEQLVDVEIKRDEAVREMKQLVGK
jgi:outer membrane protein TolC